ncbi:MAG TPA: DUF5995 family protein, partial [Pseudomonadales bacterium]|nr:DUF5995 family protein [Pseudomonadales bacterium]
LVDSEIAALGEIWQPLKLLAFTRVDNTLFNFSMEKARDQAWKFAERLAPLSIAQQEDEIRDKDFEVDLIAKLIAHPGLPLAPILLPVRLSENGRVSQKIEMLASHSPASHKSGLSLLINA